MILLCFLLVNHIKSEFITLEYVETWQNVGCEHFSFVRCHRNATILWRHWQHCMVLFCRLTNKKFILPSVLIVHQNWYDLSQIFALWNYRVLALAIETVLPQHNAFIFLKNLHSCCLSCRLALRFIALCSDFSTRT